jgi:hypothetical protein
VLYKTTAVCQRGADQIDQSVGTMDLYAKATKMVTLVENSEHRQRIEVW